MSLVLEVLWFLLPLSAANMTPVFARHALPAWNWPIDGGRKLQGTRIFGSHKTVRGLVCGVAAATLAYWIQRQAFAESSFVRDISILDYDRHGLWLGAVLGAGALGGDLVKSFAKRRIGIAPGKPWFPFDQLDWIIGGLIVSAPFARLDAAFVGMAVLIGVLSTLLVRWLGYLVRLNAEPL